MISIILITFSWASFFINLISLKILLASTGSSKARVIFLIATFAPVSLSRADLYKYETKLNKGFMN